MARKRKQDIDRAAVFEAILGDLGPEQAAEAAGSVALAELVYNPQQPRKHFAQAALADLAESIREKGVLEPIIVRRVAAGYEVVAGERRARAARQVGLEAIPAIVVDLSDREALEIAITENLQREDLNAVEETEAVLGLLELALDVDRARVQALLQDIYNEERGRAGGAARDLAKREEAKALFRRLGRFTVSSFVTNRLPILDFPPRLLDVVRNGELAFTKAQAIARLEDEAAQRRLLAEAIDRELSLSQIRRRITELREGEGGAEPERPVSADTQRLVAGTKRLLNHKRLATLAPAKLERVTALLDELRRLLG
mgnify:CR=1 FL=1